MPLPRTSDSKIYTLRSTDFPADKGVLPTDEHLKKKNITVQFTEIKYNNIDSDATEEEIKYLTTRILEYLRK